ncbi:MAG: selenium cofactor biosynthesis protein YqeC [Candidatus Caldatribacteriota bacterium]
MKISKALELKEKAFISLIGAGGKSAIFRSLAEELIQENSRIVLTTTTKMYTWQLDPLIKKGKLIEGNNEEPMRESIEKYFSQKEREERLAIVVGGREKSSDEEKFFGLAPGWLDNWWRRNMAEYFLVEADGAAGRPIKAPAPHEPVIPLSTTHLIGVIGIDAVGLSLEEKNVFRSQIFSQKMGIKLGEKLNLEHLSRFICHPEGLFKIVPENCLVHLFINKVEKEKDIKIAEELAFEVLKFCHQKITSIIVGAAHQSEAVKTLIKRID